MTDLQSTAGAMVRLGGLALDFGRVDRITYHQDGLTPESDTDHTVMLGLIACAIAAQHFPDLNVGLIAQYALVHDLVEVYAGDTPTLRMPSANAKAEKQQREHAAALRIHGEFGRTMPWLPMTINTYEARRTPEARFVKALDKLLPKITHILNGAVTIHKQGMSPAELAARYENQVGELEEYAADFPGLFDLRAVLVERVLSLVGDGEALT
jgi:putative hydrolase of HD superfamily